MPRLLSRTPPFIVGALFVTAFMASPSAAGENGEDKRLGDIVDVAVATDVDAGNSVIDTIDTVILLD